MTELRCVLKYGPEMPEEEIRLLQQVADDFSRAIELGFFFPATQPRHAAVEDGKMTSDGWMSMEISLQSESFSSGWLAVLEGMYEWLRLNRGLTVSWSHVLEDGVPVRIAAESFEQLAQKAKRPFSISMPEFIGFGEQITLLMQFAYPPNEKARDEFELGLKVWASLVLGGLPPEGQAKGGSCIGATSGFFVAPSVYQYFVEGIAAHMVSLDLLFNFLSAGGNRFGIISAEVEV
jgi:hypothetical protein